MGLDVYAGTLTRYYSGNWKTMSRRYAEENMIQFHTVHPGGTRTDTRSPKEVEEAIIRWRDAVAAGLGEASSGSFLLWEENNEKPYRTGKPDWDAYGALVLHAACLQLGEPLPETVDQGWNWQEHPVLRRAWTDNCCGGSLANGVEFWLPFQQRMIFRYSDIFGKEARFGTVGGLLSELEGLNQAAWGADRETVRRWRSEEGYGVEYDMVRGLLSPCAERRTSYSTQSLAKFAFAILYELAEFALETGVPLKLDY